MPISPPPPALLRRLQRAYEGREVPLGLIAKGCDLSVDRLKRLAETHGWQRLTSAARAELLNTEAPPPRSALAAAQLQQMVDRVTAILQREIAAIEAGGAGSAPVPTLVKLLTDLKRVAAEAAKEGAHDDHNAASGDTSRQHSPREHSPRDLAALRADLVARLERLRSDPAGERDSAGLDAG